MRTRLFRCGLGMLVLGLTSSVLADDLEAVEKKIGETWKQVRSMSAKMTMKMEMAAEGFSSKTDMSGTYDFMRKGDKNLYRMDMTTISTTTMGGQDTKSESKSLTVSDGDFDYTLSETNGEKHATKMKSNKDTMDPTKWLSDQKAMFNMKLLPEEKVEGHDCWVIEATPKSPEQAMAGKSVWYYAKDLGTPLKYVGYGADGKQNQLMTYTDVKMNEDINPDKFVFKAPEGVTVQEMPGMSEPAPAPEKPDNP